MADKDKDKKTTDDGKKIISERFHIKVNRTQKWEEESESASFGKDKSEKSTRTGSDNEDIIDVIVDVLDIKKFIKLVYDLDK